MASQPLLDVSGLNVFFKQTGGDPVRVIADLSFTITAGERVGMVGESGCGKTVTGLSILSLLPPQGARVTGRIGFEGTDLLALGDRQMREIRGRSIAMIFQEPMSALDPVFTIGQQIAETIRTHFRLSPKEAKARALEALADVGIPLPARRYDEYPHQLSGGMRQRAMIAIALSCEPKLLIADEPTTALDVTIQAQIVDLLLNLTQQRGTALLFITHDLGVVAETCSRVITMYAGEVVEDADVDDVLVHPQHPYTSGLLRSLPRLSAPKSLLPAIPGRVPSLTEIGYGCRFAPRCTYALPACGEAQVLRGAESHRVRCCRAGELALAGAVS
jgi:peptide/nickel transport system ATP-binding protein